MREFRISRFAELSVEELKREEAALQEQIFRLRFQLQTGNAENPARIREARRGLARVKTLLREHELGIQERRRGKAAGEGAVPGSGSEVK